MLGTCYFTLAIWKSGHPLLGASYTARGSDCPSGHLTKEQLLGNAYLKSFSLIWDPLPVPKNAVWFPDIKYNTAIFKREKLLGHLWQSKKHHHHYRNVSHITQRLLSCPFINLLRCRSEISRYFPALYR